MSVCVCDYYSRGATASSRILEPETREILFLMIVLILGWNWLLIPNALKWSSAGSRVKKAVRKNPVPNSPYSSSLLYIEGNSQSEVPGNPQVSHFDAHHHDCSLTTMLGGNSESAFNVF